MPRTVPPSPSTRHAPFPYKVVGLSLPLAAYAVDTIPLMACSVLVVDDDRDFRRLAARMLASLELAVVGEAGTVAEAEALAAELRPDAALVDVGLPDGDGLELAERLAALPWRPRVVITSSDAEATSPAGARALGAIGFVAKGNLLNGSLRGMLTGE